MFLYEKNEENKMVFYVFMIFSLVFFSQKSCVVQGMTHDETPITENKKRLRETQQEESCANKRVADLERQNPEVVITNTLEQVNVFFGEIKSALSIPKTKNFVLELSMQARKIESQLSEESLESIAQNPCQIKYLSSDIQREKSWIIDKWPHQNWKESIMGELFYPTQLRNSDNLCFELYDNETVRYCLALSSYYKNPLACYHLAQASKNFFFSKKQEVKITAKAKALEKKLKNQANIYFNRAFADGSSYTKALSSWYLSNRPETPNLMYQAVHCNQEYRLISYLGLTNKTVTNLKDYYKQAILSYDSAFMGLSNLAENPSESILWALEAGAKGISSGYYAAVLKITSMEELTIRQEMDKIEDVEVLALKEKFYTEFSQEVILTYLRKAEEMGMIAACQKRAEILIQRGESPIEPYMQATKLGDEQSWYRLGKIFEEEGKIIDAESCYENAGIYGYARYFRICDNVSKKDLISQKIYNHLHRLFLISLLGPNVSSEDLLLVE